MEITPQLIPTDPKTGFEDIQPGTAYPPPAFIMKKLNKRKAFLPRNPILRFIWLFFREGF